MFDWKGPMDKCRGMKEALAASFPLCLMDKQRGERLMLNIKKK
jgi:hypothetical protein